MAHSITAALQQIRDDLNTHVTPEDIQAACRVGWPIHRVAMGGGSMIGRTVRLLESSTAARRTGP